VGLGLEPRTLQFLICEAHQRLKGKSEGRSGNDECRTGTADAGLTTKSQRHEEPAKTGTVPERVGRSSSEGLSPVFAPDRVPNPKPDDERRTINDGTLPGCMSGPRPPADPAAGSSPTPGPSPLTPEVL
jgi:hypothetical protein